MKYLQEFNTNENRIKMRRVVRQVEQQDTKVDIEKVKRGKLLKE